LQSSLDKKRAHMEQSVKKMEKAAKKGKKGGDQKKLGQVASRKKKLLAFGADKTEDGKRWKYSLMGYRAGSVLESGIGVGGKRTMRLLSEPSDPELKFHFPNCDPIGVSGPILQLQHVTFGYDSTQPLFSDVCLDFTTKSRISLLGRNGLGKSTILSIILGQLTPTEGKVFRNHNLRLAMFAQHHIDQLDLSLTPLQHLANCFPTMKELEIRACLGHFGLGGKLAVQKMQTLSGGQKSRVIFALVTHQNPHILILDEPTNHLDYDTINALTEAIKEFEGGVILVSHNQALVNATCNEFWEIKKRKVTRVEGGLKEYAERCAKEVGVS